MSALSQHHEAVGWARAASVARAAAGQLKPYSLARARWFEHQARVAEDRVRTLAIDAERSLSNAYEWGWQFPLSALPPGFPLDELQAARRGQADAIAWGDREAFRPRDEADD